VRLIETMGAVLANIPLVKYCFNIKHGRCVFTAVLVVVLDN
jgi:hypothetical protein